MNIDDGDLTPAGGSLSRPVLGPRRQIVATFTPTEAPDPADLWQPFTRTTGMTRGGIQGAPLGGYQPGHGIEHEPLDQDEKQSQHLVRFDHAQTASSIRSALRPGAIAG